MVLSPPNNVCVGVAIVPSTNWLTPRYPEITATGWEVAWAAGFLEGEGMFLEKSDGARAVCANQVNPEPLQKLQALFGGSLGFQKQDPSVRRNWWRWSIYGQRAIEVTSLVSPFLSSSRLERIPFALRNGAAPAVISTCRCCHRPL